MTTQPIKDNGHSASTEEPYKDSSTPTLSNRSSASSSPLLHSLNDDDIRLLELPGNGAQRLHRPQNRGVGWIDSLIQNSNIVSWLNGPTPSRKQSINPIFPKIQARLSTCLSRRSSAIVAIIVMVLWAITFGMILGFTNDLPPGESQPMQLSCTTRLWVSTTYCGLNGTECEPFLDHPFSFMCPSGCAAVQVLEPHTIGNQEVNYASMVIGGPSSVDDSKGIYRGDSFICQAAIHAGIIRDKNGGCGMLKRTGEHGDFIASSRNGISSIGFQPGFPLSYSIESTDFRSDDPQWNLFILSVVASTLISLLVSSAKIFVTSVFCIIFFQISLASDRPYFTDFPSTFSLAIQRFLPTAFLAVVVYRYCIRHTLHDLQAPLERTVLWLGSCWVGALNNYTFDKIPISRLTAHDLRQQPGAILALIIIVLAITAAGVGQALAFRREGRLLRYIGIYLLLGSGLGLLAAIPNLQLRLHHYIIALLLLPGTALQTRPSFIYQGVLFGLLINGIARWGSASILQTANALRGDGQLESALPEGLRPESISQTSISFIIQQLAKGFDGISVLVNDVERFYAVGTAMPILFNWTRSVEDADPTFLRFAFTSLMPLGGTSYGDYTKPGIWYANGTWEDMRPGPSK